MFAELKPRVFFRVGEKVSDEKPCFGVPLGHLMKTDAKIFGSDSLYADVDSLHEMTYSIRFRSALEDPDEEDEDLRYTEEGHSWEVESDGTPTKKVKKMSCSH